ncbi:MAG: hypothetical protein WKF88_06825 [Ferruginibacter sp.]
MDNNNNTTDPGKHERFKDEQTDKRVHEILGNESDEVTEQDIRNIRTDVGVKATENASDETAAHLPDGKAEEFPEEKKIEDDSDPSIDTSWNVLGS